MQEEVKLPETSKESNEVVRVAGLLFKQTPYMVRDYKSLVAHTGGLTSASMAVAYNKGLSDALKFILKEMKNEEKQDPTT